MTNLADGIRTVTESDDPAVMQLIKNHVADMGQRVAAGNGLQLPMQTEALRTIIRDKSKIRTTVEPTAKGVIVTQTSDDRSTVAALQEHAAQVSNLVRGGMAALHTAMMQEGGPMHGAMGGMHAMGGMRHGPMHGPADQGGATNHRH